MFCCQSRNDTLWMVDCLEVLTLWRRFGVEHYSYYPLQANDDKSDNWKLDHVCGLKRLGHDKLTVKKMFMELLNTVMSARLGYSLSWKIICGWDCQFLMGEKRLVCLLFCQFFVIYQGFFLGHRREVFVSLIKLSRIYELMLF